MTDQTQNFIRILNLQVSFYLVKVNPVADGWAGAIMQKPLGIQKCDVPTYRRTDVPTDTARCRVACPRLKRERERWRERQTDRQTDKETDIGFVASMHNYHQEYFKIQKNFD